MKRGEIYFIKSSYTEVDSEQRADRPAVIVSNNNNNNSATVEVVYLTTKPKNDLPTHVYTRSALRPSTILCEQICTVSINRVAELIGELTETEMQAVDNALMISLGLDYGQTEGICPSDCRGMVEAEPIMREPTDDEWEAMRESVRREMYQNMTIHVDPEPEQSAELIKAQTERDVYKELYMHLLEHMKEATAS